MLLIAIAFYALLLFIILAFLRKSKLSGGIVFMLTLRSDQKVSLGFRAEDTAGNPAPIEGVQWTSSDEDVLSVDSVGTIAEASAVGPAGTAQVVLTADVRIGEKEVPLQGILDVQPWRLQ